MRPVREPSPATYARAIERCWSERIERAIVLSPREWVLVSEWYARGIPLDLVVESMDAAVLRQKTGRTRSAARSLIYLAPSVEEAWAVVLAGRLRATQPEPGRPARRADTVEAWRRRRDSEPPHSALALLLLELLRRHEAGEPPEQLDLELDRDLPGSAEPDQVEALRSTVEHELAEFRSRMVAGKYEATLRKALVERLRDRLELPRLRADGLC